MISTHSVWPSLLPEPILTMVESQTGMTLSGLFLSRNSYINRVFEVEDRMKVRHIIKLYRPDRWTTDQINDEIQTVLRLKELDIPVVAPEQLRGRHLHQVGELRFVVLPKTGGRQLADDDPESFEILGRTLGRLHRSLGPIKMTHRYVMHPESVTVDQVRWLKTNRMVPKEHETLFFKQLDQFLMNATVAFKGIPLQSIHGDFHLGNIRFRPEEGIHIFDWDDCCTGPLIHDIWMAAGLSGESGMPLPDGLEDEYDQFLPFPRAQLKLIPILRGMRMIYFCTWCAIQREEPHFTSAFPEWGTAHYWRRLMTDLSEFL